MGKYFLYRDGVPRILNDASEEEAVAAAKKEEENFPGLKIELYAETKHGSQVVNYKKEKNITNDKK